jgi:uncharacterized protein with FMN-binding domain
LRRVILAICATAAGLVLLLSFKTHLQSGAGASPAAALGTPAPGPGGEAGSAAAPSGSAAAQSTGAAQASGKASASPPASGAAKTVTGEATQTIYGPVQVQITVSGGKITAATALEYPEESPRDQQINSYAIPQLNQEAVTAGSANIHAVSGATYTSGGYIGSLQNAVDKAGIS